MRTERVSLTKRLKDLGWMLLSVLLAALAVVPVVAARGVGRGPGAVPLALVAVGSVLLLGSALTATRPGRDAAVTRHWRLRLLWSGLFVAFVGPPAYNLLT